MGCSARDPATGDRAARVGPLCSRRDHPAHLAAPERKALEEAGDKRSDILSKAKAACDGLLALVSTDEKPSARAVLGYVAETRLFTIPDVLAPFATAADEVALVGDTGGESDDEAGEEEEVDLKERAGRVAPSARGAVRPDREI